MTSVGLGALAAVAASSLFSVGLVVQSLEAITISDDHSLHLSLVVRLLRRRRWVLGGVVMLVGFAFHVTAFTLAPLTVVQPALATGLLVLLVVGLRARGRRIRRREGWGVAGIILGVVALSFTTTVRATTYKAGVTSLGLSLGGLAAAALAAHGFAVVRTRRGSGGSVPAEFGAGVGYALTGLTTKLLSDGIAAGDWAAAGFWLTLTALVATLALLDQTSALQHRSVIEVGPIVFVVPVVVPVLLAPALFGESWSRAPHGAVPLLLAVGLVCAGAVALAGSSSVAAATAAPRAGSAEQG
jgi:hypothetical protein